MSNICLKINNSIEISNNGITDNAYILNGINNVIDTSYGLYKTSGTNIYSITNIPKKYPIGFTSDTALSNLIYYDVSYNSPIKIYVGKNNDLSFSNSDFFRFYDECFNLINISGGSNLATGLTNSGDNFYFMTNMEYKFIATTDFCNIDPFSISGDVIKFAKKNDGSSYSYSELILYDKDDSFTFKIPDCAANTDVSKIIYQDISLQSVSGSLEILVDSNDTRYYYGDISLSVRDNYETTFPSKKISAKSYPFFGITSDVSNSNIFNYNTFCIYIAEGEGEIVNVLINDGRECLNNVSEAKLDTSANAGNLKYYEFNLNNHGSSEALDILYELDYGIYDGSYVIFNVDQNYPITIINNSDSNLNIYVDETYDRTGILHKSDIRISNLPSPYNTYNYYYNAIRFIVDNPNNLANDNEFVAKIHLFNLINSTHYDLSSELYYTTFCTDSDTVNNKGTLTPINNLYNQRKNVFSTDFSSNENKYILNLDQSYVEPEPPYKIIDRYGHDISNLLISNAPLNISDIDFNNPNFIISYYVKDYEENIIELHRLVEIFNGPFIEISGNTHLFDNSNTYTNNIDLSTNTYQDDYNFFENIKVYVFDNNNPKNKIYLPFEIGLNGEFYTINSTYMNSNKSTLNKNIIGYDNIKNKNNSSIIFNNQKFYLSNNIEYDVGGTDFHVTSENGMRLKNINSSSLTVNNRNSTILSNYNILWCNENLSKSYNRYGFNQPINTINLDSTDENLIITNVAGNTIDLSQNLKSSSEPVEYLFTQLTINNTEFKIDIKDLNNSSNNVIIDGSFLPVDFYRKSEFIDLSYIGDYTLKIIPLGLDLSDNFYYTINNIVNVTALTSDISRVININIIDKLDPCLNFVNNQQHTNYYKYIYSRTANFNIFKDIDLFKKSSQNAIPNTNYYFENSNKPLIEFSDNSIYEPTLNLLDTFGSIKGSNIKQDDPNLFPIISVKDKNLDASALINYRAIDLCGNISNDISLSILFKNVPYVTLSGETLRVQRLNEYYEEYGYGISLEYNADISYWADGSFTVPVNTTSDTTGIDISYDISWSTNLNVTTVNKYYNFWYHVQISGGNWVKDEDYVEIKRYIELKDFSSPWFLFPDISFHSIPRGYIDASTSLANDDQYQAKKDISSIYDNYTPITNKNIDFSLSIHSHFDDLSRIIHNYDVCDNYYHADGLLSTIITLSIQDKNIEFSANALFNEGFLNSDFCLNKVSIGINDFSNLIFTYKVTDPGENFFEISRNVDIIDKTIPSIEFLFDPVHSDFSYSKFIEKSIDLPHNRDISYRDFSFQAHNYTLNDDLFLNEISSVIFDFSLIDNYEANNNNYIITISGHNENVIQDKIKTINDITRNDVKLLFSKVDTSFSIIYEISDNQFNTHTINRLVNITNFIKPIITFKNINNNNYIKINFGDTNYDLRNDFTANIPYNRFLESDVNIDLSYIVPLPFTTICGSILYDQTALIYGLTGNTNYNLYDVSYYTIGYGLSSEIAKIQTEIVNPGPSFEFTSELIDSSYEFYHEAGELLPDASFIFGIKSFSLYDEFYYHHNSDISYTNTIFEVSYNSFFNQNYPLVGTYTISYESTDRNNKTTFIQRILYVNDTKPPIITVDIIPESLNQQEVLTMPNVHFLDKGTHITHISIDLSNSNDTAISTKNFLNITNINDFSYNYLPQNILLLNQNDTSFGNIQYTITYKATDSCNNTIITTKQINIILLTNLILTPKLGISGNYLNLNTTFNDEFVKLLNNNTQNLSDIFLKNSISYNSSTKTIIYDAQPVELFNNNIKLDLSAIYIDQSGSNIQEDIPKDNITVTHSILPNIIDNYVVIFQAFESTNFNSEIKTINFNVKDITAPRLSFISSLDYPDIDNIKLPLLSRTSFNTLLTNINFLNNHNLTNPYLFTRDNNSNGSNDLIYSIPGINIVDFINGTTITLSNETIPSTFETSFGLEITYSAINTPPAYDISNQYLLLNENSYIQNYRVFDDTGNFSDISRVITVERFPPFLDLNYEYDHNFNIHYSQYHEQFRPHIDLLGRGLDYYNGLLSSTNLRLVNYVRESILGKQTVSYELKNSIGDTILSTATREVNIINIDCLERDVSGLEYLIRSETSKLGLYDGSYVINIHNSNDAIRIYGYDHTLNINYDISNLINISGEYVRNYNDISYHWGKINMNVNHDFNRANIEYLDENNNKKLLKDIFLYTDKCDKYGLIKPDMDILNTYVIDVSGYNNIHGHTDTSFQYFTLNNEKRPNFHLEFGKYKFIQNSHKNFYNQIKFSVTEDGTHNGGVEYWKDVYNYSLAGLHGSYTELLMTATTPSPLYYYSENFPNMGGKIETRNNLTIFNANIYIIDNMLSIDNSNILQSFYSTEFLINKIILSHKFDLSSNIDGTTISNEHFNCITHQNINHNILVNKGDHKVIFKKYQCTDGYDPFLGGAGIMPLYNPIPTYDLSNNIKHDVSNNYLFDMSVNNSVSYIFQYRYRIDTSVNLITNTTRNTLVERLAIIVWDSASNNMGYSNDGSEWFEYSNKFFNNANSIGYNSNRWIILGNATSHSTSIIYSDDGLAWFASPNSSSIFSTEGNDIIWNDTQWIAVGQGTNTIAYSTTNGYDWIGLGTIMFSTKGNKIAWNGSRLVAVGEGTNSIIYSDDNGINWTSSASGNSLLNIGLDIHWCSKLNKWLVVGEPTGGNTPNILASSSDGITWTATSHTLLDINTFKALTISSNDDIIILGGEKLGSGTFTIIYSNNLIDWFAVTDSLTIFPVKCNKIVWDSEKFYGVGENTNTMATSIIGTTWIISNNPNISTNNIKDIFSYVKKTIINEEIKYEMDLLNIFYNFNELDNYYHYFRRNRITDVPILRDDFIYIINELAYILEVFLINADTRYDYFMGDYLRSNRVIFSHILDNYINFNLHSYLDLSNLQIDKDRLEHLRSNVFKEEITKFLQDDNINTFLFEEFIVTIYSDICGQPQVIDYTDPESIIFHNGSIEFGEYLLDSVDSSGLLYKLYNDLSVEEVDKILENRIYFSLRDISMTYHDYNNYIGLTQQNLFHNMFIDDENQFIFHKYNPDTNNYQVNSDYLTLEKTLRDASNNKKYLLEINEDDRYKCFTKNTHNIYDNGVYKNNYNISGDYLSVINYFMDIELDNSSSYLSQFDIIPRSLNNVNYNTHPYTYSVNLKKNHSHSYVINLNDYFDRYFYDNSSTSIPWNCINFNYLKYTILDVSFIHEFNIYDICANFSIIYDKSKITVLNHIQSYIKTVNFKLDHLFNIRESAIIFKNNVNDYKVENFTYDNTITVQNLDALYEIANAIPSNYTLRLANSLNSLYANNFYNTRTLKQKYNTLIDIFNFHQRPELLYLTSNTYEDLIDYTNIDKMLTDISLIDINIDSIYNNTIKYFYNEDDINEILAADVDTPINTFSDFEDLKNLAINFYEMKNEIDKLEVELNTRHPEFSLKDFSNIILDYSYNDLYKINDITSYYHKLIDNYVSLDKIIDAYIQDSDLYVPEVTSFGSNVPNTTFSRNYQNTNIGLADFSNETVGIHNNFNRLADALQNFYNYEVKPSYYDKINYIMHGSELLINSYRSNNILIKFQLNYNSALFKDVYLDTIVLDIAIPDFTPPTIIFKTEDLSFSQGLSTNKYNNIDTLMELLINDISYIEINQSHPNFNKDNINYSYQDVESHYFNTVTNNEYTLLSIDLSQVYNPTFDANTGLGGVNIYYTITDSANNTNTIFRNYNIISAFDVPVFYYGTDPLQDYLQNNDLSDFTLYFLVGEDITIDGILSNITAVDPGNNNQSLPIDVVINTYIDTTVPGQHDNAITISATGDRGSNTTNSIDINVNIVIVLPGFIPSASDIKTCCPPKTFYLPIQHNYKQGASASSAMRLAKIIRNS